jgi:hypothetical protein
LSIGPLFQFHEQERVATMTKHQAREMLRLEEKERNGTITDYDLANLLRLRKKAEKNERAKALYGPDEDKAFHGPVETK